MDTMRQELATPRERFAAALDRKPLAGRVPHFELVFFLTMEAFGRVHPSQRAYRQWIQMRPEERAMHVADIAGLYVATAERYEHSAVFLHSVSGWQDEEMMALIDEVRRQSAERYFLLLEGDVTYGMPSGSRMSEFCCDLMLKPDEMKDKARKAVDWSLERFARFQQHGGVDGVALCSDYCFNTGPYISPDDFATFITPYLSQLIAGYREMGFYTIKHTDGNIMPIIDQLVSARPHAIHSLDPQGGIDIAEVKRLYGSRICLIGNVNCGLMDTGSEEEVRASARYALESGMPGGGYIFSTSNCIYTGMRLSQYEAVLDEWRQHGNYV